MGGGRAGIGGAPPSSRTPPPPCTWPLGGARAVCGVVCTSRRPLRHHGNRHHGGTFTRVSTATAQSLATATPPGGTRALSPRQVFSGGGDRQEGARPAVPPHTPPSSCPPPSLARNRWKDRRTDTPRHSTCITYCPRWVPLVNGVLEVSPQLVKGYNLGKGRVLVRVGAAFSGPPPVLL